MADYQWLVNFGFAAVVAMFALVRIEAALKDNTKALNLLALVVARTAGQDINKTKAEYGGD